MGWLAVWVILSSVVAIHASSRGRSGLAWFVVSMVLTPIVGYACAALMPPRSVPPTA